VINSLQFDEVSALAEEAEGRLLIQEAWVQFRYNLCVIYVGKNTYRECFFKFSRFDVLKAV